jgi:spermidine synthase
MSPAPAPRHYAAVFVISLALLMQEIAVARTLSVALFSHYAFVAISLAMFGIGLSGLAVYLFPVHFAASRLDRQVVSYAAGFGVSAVLSVLVFLNHQVVQELSAAGLLSLAFAYGVLAVPFFLGGVCVSLLMTHFSARIDRIYFADLAGAGAGCLAVVTVMQGVPAPEVPLIVALLATGSAVLIAARTAGARRLGPALALAAAVALVATNAATDLFRMRFVKSWTYRYSELERWNAFSRVSVIPDPRASGARLAGDGERAAGPDMKMLDIDGAAWTPMLRFDGEPGELAFLRGSVIYAAHALRPGARVLIVGTGGGRDILAAKAFAQPSVLGIELNPLMREIVQEAYGDYSGRPYTLDGVEVIIDEARSRFRALDRRFDVIQLSLIDTFALNGAGGFVFSENYLYTTESFREFHRLLAPDGVLSVSRYFVPSYRLEILKVVAMIRAAWEAEGARDVAAEVVVLRQGLDGTVLARRGAYTGAELDRIRQFARENGVALVYDPSSDEPSEIGDLLRTESFAAYLDGHPFLIRPATDDRPFFFSFLRGRLAPGDVPEPSSDPFQFLRQWQDALILLYGLVAVVTLMAVLFFFVPLLAFGRRSERIPASTALPLLLYFACLGYGFMMIEIPLLQRFMLLLGYPVYALAVVLFALLLFSGCGSLLSLRLGGPPGRNLTRVLTGIVVIAALYVLAVPALIDALLGTPIALRIAATIGLLAPIGLPLGMAYPLGITVLRTFDDALVPWAWGINGALSVVASVGAIFLGSRIGFSAAFLTGVAAYALALAIIALVQRDGVPSPVVEAAAR